MIDPRIIEVGAEAAYHATPRNKPYDKLTLFKKNLYRAESAAVITAYEAHLRAEGFVVVPKSALDWLFGEGPDADGKWFGETIGDGLPKIAGKYPRTYWWRSKFRAMLSAATTGENDASD